MTFCAAVFDMDGLLLDTERVCQKAFKQACDVLSLPFLEDVYLNIIGRNAQGIEKTICEGYGPELNYEQLRDEWTERYHSVVYHQAIPVKAGILDLLTWLQSQSIPIALATSTPKELAIIKLKLAGLLDFFDVLSTGCEVTNGKPHPEIFLLAAERLKVNPTTCLAFEDSNNGVRSAVAAGMQTYQIPDLVQPNKEIVQLGHQIHPSMSDVLTHLKGTN
jgi:HAD superfamily hydrolase (TIGR01509 family)